MDIITSHVHLDLDGLASMILAKKLYPQAIIVLSGDVGENLKELINFYKEELEIHKASDIKSSDVNKIIMVDTSNLSRLGKFSSHNCETIILDHHLGKKFGANTTLILQEIFKEEITITPLEATIALMGIYEDTGNFTFNNTSYYDMEAGAKLLRLGANLEITMKYVSKSLSQKDLEFMITLMKHGEIYEINHQKIFITVYESENFYNGIDVLINKIMELEGSDACFIIHGNNHRNSVIARSNTKKIPIDRILDVFSGGGHTFAGSTVVKDKSQFEIKTLIIEQLKKNSTVGKIALDIMKSPVKTVEPNSNLKDILKLMREFSFSGFPIVEKGILLGIISRRDVEKAVAHGLGNAPAKAYMTKNVITGKSNSSLEDIKKIMVENEISRVPITSFDNKLFGLITRSDLLEGLYNEKFYKNYSYEKNESQVFSKYVGKLPAEYHEILKKIELVSTEQNKNCYLVGGIVRDLLLGIPNLDIDLVIEGNAIDFGESLSKKIGVKKIIKHEQFKTCNLYLDSGLNIDIASSRVEYYEYPSSLPTVEYGNIKEDLYRRDFTINSMAIKLSHGEFGKLIDYYGGYKDLQDKKIRILHNLSFIEDPTRVIRAIRFAVRYDFEFHEDTYKFMEEAVSGGYLNNLSWQRFKNELIIMLKERSFIKAIDYLVKLNIIQKIHGKIIIDEKIRTHLHKAQELSKFFEKIDIEVWLIYLLIILENLEKTDLDFIFQRFTFHRDFIKNYDYDKQTRNVIKEKLINSKSNSQMYEVLILIPKEIIALIYIEHRESRKNIELYFDKIFMKKPLVTGNDLINLGLRPNVMFKSYLNNIYKLQLDNENYNKNKLIEVWKEREM